MNKDCLKLVIILQNIFWVLLICFAGMQVVHNQKCEVEFNDRIILYYPYNVVEYNYSQDICEYKEYNYSQDMCEYKEYDYSQDMCEYQDYDYSQDMCEYQDYDYSQDMCPADNNLYCPYYVFEGGF